METYGVRKRERERERECFIYRELHSLVDYIYIYVFIDVIKYMDV